MHGRESLEPVKAVLSQMRSIVLRLNFHLLLFGHGNIGECLQVTAHDFVIECDTAVKLIPTCTL